MERAWTIYMEGVERIIMIKREDIDDNILISLNKRNENWQIVEDIKNDLNTQKEEYANYKDSTNLKIAKVEKELNDYKSTMANVNVNQEAKQKATGYGVVSLPKNSANGQVNITLKGNTVTDEIGTKSTQSASRLKSVGKNLINSAKMVSGKTINLTTGAFEDSNTFWRTDYIPVEPDTQYTSSGFSPIINNIVFYYDKSKKYISRENTTLIDRTFTTPLNCYFVAISQGAYSSTIDQSTDFDIRKTIIQLEKGTLATPYEPYTESNAYVVAKDNDNKIVNLKSLPNGVKDEVRVSEKKAIIRTNKKVLEASDISNYTVGANVAYVDISKQPDAVDYNNQLGNAQVKSFSLANYDTSLNNATTWDDATLIDKIGARYSATKYRLIVAKSTFASLADAQSKLAGLTLTYQLAEPIITPINVSGNLISYPSGTVYIEPVVADAGMYTTKLNVLNTDLPINYIEKLSKVDFNTGVETELDSSKCVIAEDKLSFTHPDLTANDIVFFTYYHNVEGTQGETTIEYYDSRHVLKDTVTGKFYKVVPTVADGVLTNQLVEV